jgi:hypothetical protein
VRREENSRHVCLGVLPVLENYVRKRPVIVIKLRACVFKVPRERRVPARQSAHGADIWR